MENSEVLDLVWKDIDHHNRYSVDERKRTIDHEDCDEGLIMMVITTLMVRTSLRIEHGMV